MASRVEIVNMALALIGADSIMDMTDEIESARKANAMYTIVRDEVLRSHPWAFATKRASLAALAAAPAYEYQYQYEVPIDCLRVLAVSEDTDGDTVEEYEKEGNCILSDSGTIYIKYTARITDEGLFDALFTSAFSIRLASALAFPLADSAKTAEDLMAVYGKVNLRAEGVNSQEAGMPDVIGADDFIQNRI